MILNIYISSCKRILRISRMKNKTRNSALLIAISYVYSHGMVLGCTRQSHVLHLRSKALRFDKVAQVTRLGRSGNARSVYWVLLRRVQVLILL
jgi:hypothetical protein